MKKERIIFCDYLKVLACFAVIMIHVSAEHWYSDVIDANWLYNNFVNSLVTWAVPLFVTVSGYLLLDKKSFTLKNMITKYIPRIVICLVFWHFLYYFYQEKTINISNVVFGFKTLLLGKTYSHLWYLYMLIGIYLLTPILRKLVQALDQKELLYCLIGGFSLTVGISALETIFHFNFTQFISPYKVLNFNIFILYYLLGYYIKYYTNVSKKRSAILLVVALSTLVIVSFLGCYMSSRMNTSIQYTGSQKITSLLLIISLLLFFKSITIKENRYIQKLSELSFGVYLIHFLIEKILLGFGFHSYIMNPLIGNLIVSFVILCISYMICYVISKIPIGKKVIGL